jgi:stalled ribosome rescue protein Dom34
MKILDEKFTKGDGGFVKLVPDNAEDMWQLFNLLRVEDHVEVGGCTRCHAVDARDPKL